MCASLHLPLTLQGSQLLYSIDKCFTGCGAAVAEHGRVLGGGGGGGAA